MIIVKSLNLFAYNNYNHYFIYRKWVKNMKIAVTGLSCIGLPSKQIWDTSVRSAKSLLTNWIKVWQSGEVEGYNWNTMNSALVGMLTQGHKNPQLIIIVNGLAISKFKLQKDITIKCEQTHIFDCDPNLIWWPYDK